MCYVLVKDFNKTGCIAYKTRLGKPTADLTKILNQTARRKGIQVVTISRPTAFGEYAPYTFVDNKEELINAVKEMNEE